MWGVCMGLVLLCSFLSQNEAENKFHRLLMHQLEMDINTLNYYENTRDQWRAQTSGGAGAKWQNRGLGGGVARGGRYGKNITIFVFKYHDSQFYHDSLSCWFSILQVV